MLDDLHTRLVAALTARLEEERRKWRIWAARCDECDHDPAAEIRRVEATLRVVERRQVVADAEEVTRGTVLHGAAKTRLQLIDEVIACLAEGEGIEVGDG